MGKAIDFAGGFYTALPSVLKQHGIEAVIRYVGQPSNPKCISSKELHDYTDNDIGICWVYETTTNWMLGGKAAGKNAAQDSVDHIVGIGGPKRPVVYFAADWDVSSKELSACLLCLEGAASVLGADHVGVYGSYYLISNAMSQHYAYYGWEAAGWQYGHVSPAAQIVQHVGDTFGALGLSYDGDTLQHDSYGQWPAASTPAPIPSPDPPKPVPDAPVDAPSWAWGERVDYSGRKLVSAYTPARLSAQGLMDLIRG